jgi:hypothetical protein
MIIQPHFKANKIKGLVFVGYHVVTANNIYWSYCPLTSLLGGVDTQARTGDLVIASVGYGGKLNNAAYSTWGTSNGYTRLYISYQDSTNDASMLIDYKFMGATPDTQYGYYGTGGNINAQACLCQVWRNVDPVTPFDVPYEAAVFSGDAYPDPPPITTLTENSVVLQIAAAARSSTVSKTMPANMTDPIFIEDYGMSYRVGLGTSRKLMPEPGVFDPDAWTGGASSSGDTWIAVTLALREKPEV